MTMDNTDLQAPNLDYFFLGQVLESFILEITLDSMEIVGERLGPVMNLSASHIASADYSVDLVRCYHFPILGGHLGSPVRDMEIAQQEHQHSHLLFISHCLTLLFIDLYLIIFWYSDFMPIPIS